VPPGSDAGANLTPSLAKGVLAGRERRVDNAFGRLLQTDLVLLKGYSGSPLLDMNGSALGVLDQELQPRGSLGISFAVPIEEAKAALIQLREIGRVRYGWLGVQIQPITPTLADRMELDSSRGALVSEVLPETPAQRAEIRPGDVIVEFAGTAIERSGDLPGVVSALAQGTES